MNLLYIVRIDSPVRFAGLCAILGYLHQNNLTRYVLLWEIDEKPYPGLKELCLALGIKYEFHEDHDPYFHRTRWSNKQVMSLPPSRMDDGPYPIAICHADVLVPARQILAARDAILGGGKYVAAFGDETDPNGLIMANVRYLQHLQAGGSVDAILTDDSMLQFEGRRRFGSYSGQVFLDRTFYIKSGMDNENIIGWGPEEVERHVRLRKLGSGYRRIPGWAVHMEHPVAYFTDDRKAANSMEFNRINCMDTGMVEQEVQRWKRVRGY